MDSSDSFSTRVIRKNAGWKRKFSALASRKRPYNDLLEPLVGHPLCIQVRSNILGRRLNETSCEILEALFFE